MDDQTSAGSQTSDSEAPAHRAESPPRASRSIPSDDLDRAAELLRSGEIIAVPTDTVYGLAASPRAAGATLRLFDAKHRPRKVALPLLVDSLEVALALTDQTMRGWLRSLGDVLWPGALTVVVKRNTDSEIADADLGGDGSTVGLRVPANEIIRELCRLTGPLAVTSANPHGADPCTTPEQIRDRFGDELVILDGGICDGEVSTVIDLSGESPVIAREGALARDLVIRALGGPGKRD